MLRIVFAAFALAILLPTTPARAQKADAREVKAREQFALGHYAEALEIYGKLYAETTHPTYLRNIGRCYQNLGEADKAISSFREYLRQAKDLPADQRAQVEGYIREMEELQQKRAAASAPPPPVPRPAPVAPSPAAAPPALAAAPPVLAAAPAPVLVGESTPPTPRNGRRVAGIIVGSVAGAALITGGAFGLRAFSKRSASDGECPRFPDGEHCSQAGVDFNNQAKTAALVSDIAFGAGLVGAAIATYLLVVPAAADASPPAAGAPSSSPPPARALRVSPELGPGLAGLAVAGSW